MTIPPRTPEGRFVSTGEPAPKKSPLSSSVPTRKDQRSAVSNGHRLHVVPPGDGRWSRRFRDVLAEIVNDLGGPDRLSEGQRQIARRCATIAIECEKMEGQAAAGNDIDIDGYGMMTDRLGRAFQRLGIKRAPKIVTPELCDYLEGKVEAAE